jgi:hypothetical protein
MNSHADLPSAGSPVFWGEMSPSEHIAQFYETDAVFLDTLCGFIGGGLIAGEGTIVIATEPHLNALEQRLDRAGVDVARAIVEGRYIALIAEKALNKFILNDWPDDHLFTEFVTGLIARAQQNGRRVRAFGEMVALLWARGDIAATIRLERLWHEICKSRDFSLLCAYPKTDRTEDASESIAKICAAHTRVI